MDNFCTYVMKRQITSTHANFSLHLDPFSNSSRSQMSAIRCCLCLAISEECRKRKMLHHSSCSVANKILCMLSSDSIVESILPNAVICNKCEQSLNAINRCQLKLKKLKEEILEKLSCMRNSFIPKLHQSELAYTSTTLCNKAISINIVRRAKRTY